MEDEGRSRKSRDKHKRNRYYTEDDENIYYRDTEDTNARYRANDDQETRNYRGETEKEMRSYKDHEKSRYHDNESKKDDEYRRVREQDEKRPSPEGAYEKRSHRRRHKSSEKLHRSKSRDRKSVRYEETEEISETRRKEYKERGRSEERRKSRKHDEKRSVVEGDGDERRLRRREREKRAKEKNQEEDEDYIKRKLNETEDSLEKTRRERSKDRSKRKKSRDRTRRREKEKERNNFSQSDDEVTEKEKKKHRKSRRSHRSREHRKKDDITNDVSFAAPSETYEEMKKTSLDWQPSGHPIKKASEKHRKTRNEEELEESESPSEIEESRKEKRSQYKETKKSKIREKIENKLKSSKNHEQNKAEKEKRIYNKNEGIAEQKPEKIKPIRNIPESTDSKSSSLTGYESDSNLKKHKSKQHRKCLSEYEEIRSNKTNKSRHEANIKKEIRKKREPRLYHSDSEVDMKKITKTKVQINVPNSNENETSSTSSNENPDLESLYDYYKDPEQRDDYKEVTIRASSRESNDPPKKISINQTNIRGKLIRVLFQRVKELLKETEELRHERKMLTSKIQHLTEETSKLREKEDSKFAKEANLEKRLEMLADEIKITAKGTSFREEIHKILHDIQDKYQIHWREHESKIQQVQNDAEHNIQSLMKSIVGKYVEMSDLQERVGMDDVRENSVTEGPKNNKENFANLINERVLKERTANNADVSNVEPIRTVKSDSSLAEAQSVYLQRKAIRNEINRETESYRNLINRDFETSQRDVNRGFQQNWENRENRFANPNKETDNNGWHETKTECYPVEDRDNRWENGNIKAGIQKLFINEALRSNQKSTKLNEPLFIDTGARNNFQTQSLPTQNVGRNINSNKDLLLQIASKPKNISKDDDFTNQREKYFVDQDMTSLRREKTYCSGEQISELRQDSLTSLNEKKTSYDTDNLSDLQNTQNNRYFYDELKQPQYKLNVKEFWRQKLLKPPQQSSMTASNIRQNNGDPFDNKTVRNTY